MITLNYDVKVEDGELIVEWRVRKKLIWRESFLENTQGTTSFLIDRHTCFIVIEGKNTKGACSIQFTEANTQSNGK